MIFVVPLLHISFRDIAIEPLLQIFEQKLLFIGLAEIHVSSLIQG